MPGPDRGPFAYRGLALTFVGIALFSAKEGHGPFIFNVLRAIYDGNNFAHGADGLADTHALGNFFEVALRRIPIAPDFDPNLVVRRTSFGPMSCVLCEACPRLLANLGPQRTYDRSASFALETAVF